MAMDTKETADKETVKQKQGRNNRRRGANIEREIVRFHQDEGIPAEKMSRTGHSGVDISIADEFAAEVKSRKGGSGFDTINRWLDGNEILFLREVGKPDPTVVLTWATYLKLLKGYLR